MTHSICTLDGCDRRHYGKGLCNMHYQRARKRGHTGPGVNIRGTLTDRLAQSFTEAGRHQCWEWRGKINPDGYGMVNGERAGMMAHRVVYETLRESIPEGLVIDHLCRNRRCVNPYHLEPVTIAENTLRGIGPAALNARATECKYGHPFSGENLRVGPNGERTCRICAKRRSREYVERRQRAS